MFIGRKKELAILKREFDKRSSAVLVYGKRKVGKTTLILEACKEEKKKTVIYFECLKDTEERNVSEIVKLLKRLHLMNQAISLQGDSFLDLFDYLNSLREPIIFIIDEYPYLKEFTPSKSIDSVFQNIIDNHLENVNLVISGSHIGMMKDLLEEKNALFGRFSAKISLKELSYLEASEFYPSLSSYDKVAFYSVFGGSPYVNRKLSPQAGIKDNVVSLLLDQDNAIYSYVSSMLLDDGANLNWTKRILSSIGNGKKSYSELEEALDKGRNGLLSKYLKPLLEVELIKKEAPINKLGDAKKTKYEINDNLLRFYYAYIFPNQYLLPYKDAELIYKEEILPSLTTFISYRFEDICRAYLWRRVNRDSIPGIKNIGRYYYDDPVLKKNGEFDVALLHMDDTVTLFEAKYLQRRLDQGTIDKELRQIQGIEGITVSKTGFISVNGFEENVSGFDYLIDGDELYRL